MKAPTVKMKNNGILNCEGHNWNTLLVLKFYLQCCAKSKKFCFFNNNISDFDHVIQIQF